ncbi:MAG TPA: TerB family tellurite resistance protein [Phycisphaerales bacterium]|nr:TerB family tellurite resistance protein [Phycisphaerales bacterium]
MTSFERDAMGAICLLAAFADGQPEPAELERLKSAAAGASGGDGAGGLSSEVYQRVMLKQVDVGTEAARLNTPELRRQAFELAVGICDADGVTTDAERRFLMDLAWKLQIPENEARAVIDNADELAADPLSRPIGMSAAVAAPPPLPAAPAPGASDAEIDASIRNHAILCGALELLPQGLASAAIIPVQMKMVYSIGKRYGYPLDSGHVKDLLATVGVGVTSQVVESFGRRIMGGLVESITRHVVGGSLGKVAGSLARGGTGAAVTFATTYGLGQVARQYYAGGRKMSAIDLKSVFGRSVEQAKGAYGQFAPAIQQQASSLNPARLLDLVRA